MVVSLLQPTHSLLVSHPAATKFIVVSLLQPTLIVGQPSCCYQVHGGQPSSANTLIVGKPSCCYQVHRGQPSSANTHCWSAILLLPGSSWSAFFSQRSYRRPVITLLPNRVVSSPLSVFS
jgi:hypothetical protein